MKKCPYCAEEIQEEAIKCRFCGEYLKKRKKWLNCLYGCLITFVGSILLTLLLIYLSFFMVKFIIYKMFFIGPSTPQHLPFTGQGIEGILREFAQSLRALWERLMGYQRVTF